MVVTDNRRDFIPLMRRKDIHWGIICLNFWPGIRNLQAEIRMFKKVLGELDGDEPANEVVEANQDSDGEIKIERCYLHLGADE